MSNFYNNLPQKDNFFANKPNFRDNRMAWTCTTPFDP